MKFLIVALFVASATAAAVEDKDAQIVQSNYEQTAEGFKYGFESTNQIAAEAVGTLKQVGEAVVDVVSGRISYVDPVAGPIDLSYTADEYGFHPEGAHLPTPPAPEPIPEYIARALEWIAAHPYTEPKKA